MGYFEVIRLTFLCSFFSITFSFAQLGINTDTPSQALDVNGKIQVGDDQLPPTSGTIRFNSANNQFEGFNGTEWISISSTPEISFKISRNTDFTISSGSSNIPMNVTNLDIGNCVINLAGSFFFRPPVSGRYQLNCMVNIRSASPIGGVNADLGFVSGGTPNFIERFVFTRTGSSINESFGFSTVLDLVAGDYIRVSFGNAGSSSDPIVFGGNSATNAIELSGFLIK